MLEFIVPMSNQDVEPPQMFVERLRAFHEAPADQRGHLANALSEKIITKRVDLAEVRQVLLDTGRADLMDTLDRLIDLIEPYIEEGGVDE